MVKEIRARAMVKELSQQHQDMNDRIQVEKDKKKELDKALSKYKYINGKLPIDTLSLEELVEFKTSLLSLKDNLAVKENEMEVASSFILLSETGI
ncbi:unnamed protein product [Lupinus luteus]|uniref:Uncharacterized protein n=1 Tax=Lupinus luteus TaxID=3873 RepID=A0AAV1XTB3_LUPLU